MAKKLDHEKSRVDRFSANAGFAVASAPELSYDGNMVGLKQKLIAKIIEGLEHDRALLVTAATEAREAATHEESKAEDKYDTRGLEASYLAGAQARRAAELSELIKFYKFMEIHQFHHHSGIAATALVEVESQGKSTLLFIVPKGGGSTIEVDGQAVQILTPVSRLGEELMGRSAGEEFELKSGGAPREYKISRVT